MVLKDRITLNELVEKYNHWYPDRVKFCIDRKRKVIAIDRELQIGAGRPLVDEGIITELTEIIQQRIQEG